MKEDPQKKIITEDLTMEVCWTKTLKPTITPSPRMGNKVKHH